MRGKEKSEAHEHEMRYQKWGREGKENLKKWKKKYNNKKNCKQRPSVYR